MQGQTDGSSVGGSTMAHTLLTHKDVPSGPGLSELCKTECNCNSSLAGGMQFVAIYSHIEGKRCST